MHSTLTKVVCLTIVLTETATVRRIESNHEEKWTIEIKSLKLKLEDRLSKIEAKLDSLNFPIEAPSAHFCASHSSGISITSEIVPYTKLLYASTNLNIGGLNIVSGIFEAGHGGAYSVSWSLVEQNDVSDSYVAIYLRKNQQKIEESEHFSQFKGNSGRVDDFGGRTLILHLDQGDTIDLFCASCEARIDSITFCVSLI